MQLTFGFIVVRDEQFLYTLDVDALHFASFPKSQNCVASQENLRFEISYLEF